MAELGARPRPPPDQLGALEHPHGQLEAPPPTRCAARGGPTVRPRSHTPHPPHLARGTASSVPTWRGSSSARASPSSCDHEQVLEDSVGRTVIRPPGDCSLIDLPAAREQGRLQVIGARGDAEPRTLPTWLGGGHRHRLRHGLRPLPPRPVGRGPRRVAGVHLGALPPPPAVAARAARMRRRRRAGRGASLALRKRDAGRRRRRRRRGDGGDAAAAAARRRRRARAVDYGAFLERYAASAPRSTRWRQRLLRCSTAPTLQTDGIDAATFRAACRGCALTWRRRRRAPTPTRCSARSGRRARCAARGHVAISAVADALRPPAGAVAGTAAERATAALPPPRPPRHRSGRGRGQEPQSEMVIAEDDSDRRRRVSNRAWTSTTTLVSSSRIVVEPPSLGLTRGAPISVRRATAAPSRSEGRTRSRWSARARANPRTCALRRRV